MKYELGETTNTQRLIEDARWNYISYQACALCLWDRNNFALTKKKKQTKPKKGIYR